MESACIGGSMPPMQAIIARQADPDAAGIAAWVGHGDREALQAVFQRHADAALRLATNRLGNHSDAEDAVQHAFIGVMRGARSYRPEAGSVRGYILAAVVNACAQQRRSDGSRRARELIVQAARRETAEPRDPDLSDAVRLALAQLPEHQRQPVELRYLAGLEFPEIAAALGRNERTVRGQVTRGLESLREICPRLGVRLGTAALVAALGSLARPASAEAAERCAEIAATGPEASARSGPYLIGGILAALLALAMVTFALRSGHPAPAVGPAPADPSPAVAAAPAIAPPPAAFAERDRGSSFLVWSIPDDAASAEAPLAAIGSARLVDDGSGGNAEWWRMPTVPQIDTWTWGLSPKRANRKGPPWTTRRLLGAPRLGEKAYLVCVTPRPVPGVVYTMFSPASLVETADGWKLTLDGLRIDPATFASTRTTDIRGCYAFALGRLTRSASRLQVEVRWREAHGPGALFPEAALVERGEAAIVASDRADAEAASLPELAPGGVAEPPDPTRWWQVPLAKPSLRLTEAEAPAEFGGLTDAGDNPMMRAYRAAGHRDERGSLYVLGPALADSEAMTLRSVVWHGSAVTVTVAVWEQAGPKPASATRRPLMPVMLQPPSGLRGAYTIELEWRHFVADAPSAGFVLQAGRPAFAGLTRASATVPAPKTDL